MLSISTASERHKWLIAVLYKENRVYAELQAKAEAMVALLQALLFALFARSV
jgi:hypothetical protein